MQILMDGEFEPLHNDLNQASINLNITAANEHLLQIKQQIRVIKERVQATCHSLPFKMMPQLMLIKMVYNAVKWINVFPLKGGISEFLSLWTILTGTQLNYAMDCHLPFGSYIQAHEEPNLTNGQESRMVGAICIGQSGNIQGLYDFLNHCTRKKITR